MGLPLRSPLTPFDSEISAFKPGVGPVQHLRADIGEALRSDEERTRLLPQLDAVGALDRSQR